MDGLAISALCREWNDLLTRARIDKVHQPSDREIVLTVRTRNETFRLLLSANRAQPRAHILRLQKPSNPEEPPMFCMLLRKRIEGGRIALVRQQGRDRVVEVCIETLDEIGDTVHYVIVHEMMGIHSNLMLCTADEAYTPLNVVDSLVHVTPDMSRVRSILPGVTYAPAPAQNKTDAADVSVEQLRTVVSEEHELKVQIRALCNAVAGVGPVTAREVLHRAQSITGVPYAKAVADCIHRLTEAAVTGSEAASVGLDELGRKTAAAPFQLTSYPSFRLVPRFDDGLDQVYAESAELRYTSKLAAELTKAIAQYLDRLRGKLAKISELEAHSVEHEALRIKGELLTTYAGMVDKGARVIQLPNYYDNERPLEIELDPALSPIENAQRYFKQASKRKRSIPILRAERSNAESDLAYLEAVLVHVENARPDDLEASRQELEQQGFLTARRNRRKHKHDRRTARNAPDAYVSTDGFTIRVGRNNLQNDKLTLRSGQPTDVWLHVKDQPGSHVVIQANNQPVPENTLHEASLLAAWFSKARDSANAAVDYTLVKHVWKPNGARPGHVLYDNQKTLYVTPDRTLLAPILATFQDSEVQGTPR